MMNDGLIVNILTGVLAGFVGAVLLLLIAGFRSTPPEKAMVTGVPVTGETAQADNTDDQMRERLAALEALTVQDDRQVAELWTVRREACEMAVALDDLAGNGVVLEENLWRLVQKHRPPRAGEVDLSCADEREL